MRLTADILLRADSYLNAVKDRELNLRGFKIANIENFAVLEDQHDTIDLSDNELKKVDNFPLMNRLHTLLFNNNYITRIDISITNKLINLENIILTNNKISNYIDIYVLSKLPKLKNVSLLDNPIDYLKISQKERDNCKSYASSSSGQLFLSNLEKQIKLLDNSAIITDTIIDKSNEIIVTEKAEEKTIEKPKEKRVPMVLTDKQREQIKIAINLAKTKEEIDIIEKQLVTGTFPFSDESTITLEKDSNGVHESRENNNVTVEMEVDDNDDKVDHKPIEGKNEEAENKNVLVSEETSKIEAIESNNSQDDNSQLVESIDDVNDDAADEIEEDNPAKGKGKGGKKTPAKKTPAKKTPSKKTPAKKNSIEDEVPIDKPDEIKNNSQNDESQIIGSQDEDNNEDIEIEDVETEEKTKGNKKTPAKKTPAKKNPTSKASASKSSTAKGKKRQRSESENIDE